MAPTIPPERLSSYLDHLPAIYRAGAEGDETHFLGRFLLAFEALLSGIGDPERRGLEEWIESLHEIFDPARAPVEFLDWLASWVALTLREDWEEEQKRRFIARIVPLYRIRGTKAGLAEMLRTYTDMGVEIYEFGSALQVGVTSTVGVDTLIGGSPPHYFRVKLFLSKPDGDALRRQTRIARAIIDQEKPAHTYYDLEIETPTLQVGRTSTVGVDTLLGTEEA